MPSSLRIARVDVGRYRLLVADFASLQALHHQLTQTIRRHLPEVTASLLALPVPSEDGTSLDWYSDLAGEAQPLASLPTAQRKLIKDKLQDRLRSLTRLADELPRRVRGSEALAASLRAATHYPGDEQVYVVGNEPVITLWGFVRTGGRGRLTALGAATRQQRARSRWLLFAGTSLALLVLAAGAWFWLAFERDQALGVEIAEALAAGCADADRLLLLARRAEQLDPDHQRLGDLHARLAAEQARCAEARSLMDAVAAAGWDCMAISALSAKLTAVDTGRAPLDAIAAKVEEREAVCATARQLDAELDNRLGDCQAVAALAASSLASGRPLQASPDADSGQSATNDGGELPEPIAAFRERMDDGALPNPIAQARERLTAELARCDEAAGLEQELVAATAQCDRLLRLDGRLAERDVSRAPLSTVRERLDAELERCARAEAFSRELIDAQMDCQRIQQLDQRMQGEAMREPPLLPVRERLDEAVEACRELEALEQARVEAVGDCPALAALVESVSARYGGNLLFVGLRRRIAADTDRCALAERLRAALAAAMGQCTALAELQPRLESAALDPKQLSPLQNQLNAELALCRDAEDWRNRLAEAADDCRRLEALRASWPEVAAERPQFREVRADLARLEQRCRRPEPPPAALVVAATEPETTKPVAPQPQPQSQTQPAASAKTQLPASKSNQSQPSQSSPPKPAQSKSAAQRCPGVRSVAEAPQLVMVVDASGSMGEPIQARPGAMALRQLQQVGGTVGATLGLLGRALDSAASGPTRMQATKEASQRIIRGLPDDIDVGLVKIENCPSATDAGFYAPNQRGALLGRINALRPRSKTPLASAIAQAAAMVDGVRRPAVIAVISDGEDTCGGHVCAVAARIAAAKPQLRINVVDITGTGAADCAARATGGRVLRADNAEDLGRQLVRATEEVAGPAHCRGGQ